MLLTNSDPYNALFFSKLCFILFRSFMRMTFFIRSWKLSCSECYFML